MILLRSLDRRSISRGVPAEPAWGLRRDTDVALMPKRGCWDRSYHASARSCRFQSPTTSYVDDKVVVDGNLITSRMPAYRPPGIYASTKIALTNSSGNIAWQVALA